MDTEELEELEAQQMGEGNNNQGFIYAADLDTYRLNKQERKAQLEKERELNGKKEYKSGAQKRRDKKSTGSTNIEKQANKPMAMLLPKKVSARNEKRDGKLRTIKKSDLKQLGHFTRNKKQRLEAKKKRRIS